MGKPKIIELARKGNQIVLKVGSQLIVIKGEDWRVVDYKRTKERYGL